MVLNIVSSIWTCSSWSGPNFACGNDAPEPKLSRISGLITS